MNDVRNSAHTTRAAALDGLATLAHLAGYSLPAGLLPATATPTPAEETRKFRCALTLVRDSGFTFASRSGFTNLPPSLDRARVWSQVREILAGAPTGTYPVVAELAEGGLVPDARAELHALLRTLPAPLAATVIDVVRERGWKLDAGEIIDVGRRHGKANWLITTVATVGPLSDTDVDALVSALTPILGDDLAVFGRLLGYGCTPGPLNHGQALRLATRGNLADLAVTLRLGRRGPAIIDAVLGAPHGALAAASARVVGPAVFDAILAAVAANHADLGLMPKAIAHWVLESTAASAVMADDTTATLVRTAETTRYWLTGKYRNHPPTGGQVDALIASGDITASMVADIASTIGSTPWFAHTATHTPGILAELVRLLPHVNVNSHTMACGQELMTVLSAVLGDDSALWERVLEQGPNSPAANPDLDAWQVVDAYRSRWAQAAARQHH